MKKLIIILVSFFVLHAMKSQIVFCPPGAEWHYSFNPTSGLQPNEEIKYVRDSIFNGETVKVLKHTRFYIRENLPITNGSILTLLRQNGDTVYMKNPGTQNKWQILYNFAAVSGESWRDSISEIDSALMPPQGAAYSYTVVVDSVKVILVNNVPLKTLFVRYISNYNFPPLVQHSAQITERFGCNLFMFFYYSMYSGTDGTEDSFMDFLCYKDDTFGLKQFTGYACDYELGINGRGYNSPDLRIYPNPVADKLNIDFTSSQMTPFKVHVINTLGQIIYSSDNSNSQQEIDTKSLKSGVYYLTVFTESGQRTYKIIKE